LDVNFYFPCSLFYRLLRGCPPDVVFFLSPGGHTFVCSFFFFSIATSPPCHPLSFWAFQKTGLFFSRTPLLFNPFPPKSRFAEALLLYSHSFGFCSICLSLNSFVDFFRSLGFGPSSFLGPQHHTLTFKVFVSSLVIKRGDFFFAGIWPCFLFSRAE